ncbi:hypothetical protein PRK78_006247 [Emydomyces testavorans]|uniref:ADP-ribosylhydrolase ARH3 n=1 Tax=Emydomyces testavorans TaxID=2070801 RepID=A0AAF0DL10_9EURO|nr:hypothetical protein PRK78_006247 [Emydomyces testavorans]
MNDLERARRSSIRGSLFGMAICNALVPRDTTGFRSGMFRTETSLAICVARAIIEDGGYRYDKFTYIKRLLEWLKGNDLCERGGYVRRSVALALNAWDRQLAVASAMGNGGKDNEDWEMRKDRFDEMQKLIDKEFVVDCQRDGANLTCATPISLYYILEDCYSESQMRIWAQQLSSLTHPHPMNRVLCSLCCELVHFAVAAGSRTTSTSSFVSKKLDKKWMAKVFAEQVHHVWIPSDDQREYIVEVVNRLQPYKDIEAWVAKAATDLKTTSSALDVFEAALWCFFARGTFREGAIEAVRLGGDSAAIGATYGALAGAYYGYEMIPSEWISAIQTPKVLEDVVDGLEKLREKQHNEIWDRGLADIMEFEEDESQSEEYSTQVSMSPSQRGLLPHESKRDS